MKIVIAGDYCPKDRVAELIDSNSYENIFSDVTEIIAQADFRILNFECPIVNGECRPIEKNGPCLKTTKNSLKPIVDAGFNVVTLANNHFYDFVAPSFEENEFYDIVDIRTCFSFFGTLLVDILSVCGKAG